MANVILRPDWWLPESACTDPSGYRHRQAHRDPAHVWDRRGFIRALSAGAAGVVLTGCTPSGSGSPYGPDSTAAGRPIPRGPLDTIPAAAPRDGFPAPRVTEGFPEPGRALTDRTVASSYNNFYEFKNQGDLKDLWQLTADYEPFPWTLQVSGLVERETTLDVADLMRRMELQERVYRFRCVEAWSMTIPWVGFPLRQLVEACRPLSGARYVRFVSANRPDEMPGLKSSPWYPWPYYEALRMDEATHDLAFVAVGMYGEPLPKQNGSPLRLVIPWKYGYKGPKAVERIEFTDRRPSTFWNDLQPDEYSFLSNVNPRVPHPRWSQASERFILNEEVERRERTLPFNGYAEQVSELYPNERQG